MIILASGPSVREYNIRDLEKRGTLIAINGAALYCKPDLAFSMDRIVSEYCCPLWRVQGVPRIMLRAGITQNFTPKMMEGLEFFTHDSKDPTFMTPTKGFLNGSNSSTCALNLAYQWGVRRVFLLGFDMQRGPKTAEIPSGLSYWHPTYPWNTAGAAKNGKLAEWAEEFEAIKPQFANKGVKIYNVNHRSRIKAFEVISYDAFQRLTDG